jgi:alpha-L-fucosidase
VAAGQFSEGNTKPFTAADIRYTTKGGALYALTLGKPETETLTLASIKEGQVARVEVVGSPAPLSFTQDAGGLHVTLPSSASHAYGVALKITGAGLT